MEPGAVFIGIDVGKAQMLLGGEPVGTPIRQVQAHRISAP